MSHLSYRVLSFHGRLWVVVVQRTVLCELAMLYDVFSSSSSFFLQDMELLSMSPIQLLFCINKHSMVNNVPSNLLVGRIPTIL